MQGNRRGAMALERGGVTTLGGRSLPPKAFPLHFPQMYHA